MVAGGLRARTREYPGKPAPDTLRSTCVSLQAVEELETGPGVRCEKYAGKSGTALEKIKIPSETHLFL